MKVFVAVALSLSLFGAAACTADSGGDDDALTTGPCTDAASICTKLHVPDDYAGTPTKVIVGLYDALPPAGPPNGIAAVIENPTIGVGMTMDIEATDVMPAGDWFLYVVLYDEGGGEYQPVANVDYVVQTEGKVHVGDEPLNMPDMTVSLYTE